MINLKLILKVLKEFNILRFSGCALFSQSTVCNDPVANLARIIGCCISLAKGGHLPSYQFFNLYISIIKRGRQKKMSFTNYPKSSTSSSPVLPKSNFRFLPGISFFPPPNPTPAFFLNTSKSFSASSSAHSRTRCRPRRCVCRNAVYAFSASWRDTNSRKAKPRDRELNFLGRRTDLSWPWDLWIDN